MTIEISHEFTFDGEKFFGAKRVGASEHGGFIADAFTTPPPEPFGGYFTSLPVSSGSYRKRHKTRCGYEVGRDSVTIFDDWGSAYVFGGLPEKTLAAFAAECEEMELPVRKQVKK